jgi:hypothetical protein
VLKSFLQDVRTWIILVWNFLRKKPSPDAIVEEQLSQMPDEQAARIKRRLQEHREREQEVME